MLGGVAASYGFLAWIAGRFLYPARPPRKAWLYVSVVDGMAPGEAMQFRTPSGQRVNVARHGQRGTVDDFVALSSVCPHLGCQVNWEPQNDRFFCPCHNGVFDRTGTALEGPPAAAGQSLLKFPLKVEGGLLYIEVDSDTSVASSAGRVEPVEPIACCGPGVDPCLFPREDDTERAV